MSKSDLLTNKDITSPKSSIGKGKNTTTVIRYNINGEHDRDLTNKFTEDQTTAVQVLTGKNVIHKVKAKRGGHFYNPLLEGFQYGLAKRDRTTNDPLFTLKDVGESSFTNYIKYLQDRHESHLIISERLA